MTANTPTLVTFAIYLIGMMLIGWLGYRATSNLSDYILGGRSLGSFVTALSAGASDMSGWLLMGLPGAVYLSGLSQSWIAIGLCIGAWLNWQFVAARLRLYTEKAGNALTLPDYLSNRFEDRSNVLRIITSDMHAFDSFLRNKLLTLGIVSDCESHIVTRGVKNVTALPLGIVTPHVG